MADLSLVHTAVRLLDIKTEQFRFLDLHNKLELLAVWRGLKPSFAYGLGEGPPDATVVEQLLVFSKGLGLPTHLTDQPPLWEETCHTTKVPRWFSEVFCNLSNEAQSPAVLWILRGPPDVTCLQEANTNAELGRLLDYPECCVAAYEERQCSSYLGLYSAFNVKFGRSRHRILAALRDPDPWPDHPNPGIEATERTIQKYPFVFHVACDACLAEKESPTERLNDLYKELANQCGAVFYKEIVSAIQEARQRLA